MLRALCALIEQVDHVLLQYMQSRAQFARGLAHRAARTDLSQLHVGGSERPLVASVLMSYPWHRTKSGGRTQPAAPRLCRVGVAACGVNARLVKRGAPRSGALRCGLSYM